LYLQTIPTKIAVYTKIQFMYNTSIKTTSHKIKLLLSICFMLLIIVSVFYVLERKNFHYTNLQALQFIQNEEELIKTYTSYRLEKLVQNKIATMSEDEKIGQLFMISIPEKVLSQETKDLIEKDFIGAIVLMGQNVSYQNQVKVLVDSMQDISKTQLLIAVDEEGGVVARLPWDQARFISQPHIGIVDREDFAYETGKAHALALKDADISLNLAPVLDISLISNSAMSTRTLGASPEKVSKLGLQIIKAHHDVNVLATAKHFPGIGRSQKDSHLLLPIIDISKEQLTSEELVPFTTAINENIDAVMIGHALYPQIDKDYPSSLSKIIITDILKNELKFNGIVLIDDIHMKALEQYPNRIIDTVNAGADMVIIVDSYKNQKVYIDQLKNAVNQGSVSKERIDDALKRILLVKYRYEN
jgi:beta-N-acetylhexosaminidase